MMGFAIVDRQPQADATAVWLTTHMDGATVQHTNAVVLDHADDRYDKKLYALTADRIVVLTDGSDAQELFAQPVTIGALDEIITAAAVRQRRIEEAISAYAAKTKSKNLVIPMFPSAPELPVAGGAEPQLRALSTANYVSAVWRVWLLTEEQRVRRTREPKTGDTPWIMPADLNAPDIEPFPAAFTAGVKPEPLRQC